MFKLGSILTLIMFLVLTPLWAGAADLKIGVVDSNDILAKSPEGKRAQDNIKRRTEELGRPLGQKRQEIGRQLEEFQKQASVMKEEARKRKAEELEAKMKDFDRRTAAAEKQLADLQNKELGPILKKLEQAVEAVAQEDKLDLVLDKRVVLMNNKNLDITEKVRARFSR
jgi:outer membrane protein